MNKKTANRSILKDIKKANLKRKAPLAAVLLVIAVCVAKYNIPIPIDRTLSAIEICIDDPDYIADTTIKIKGTYNYNIWGAADSFVGSIEVDSNLLTGSPNTMERFTYSENLYSNWLTDTLLFESGDSYGRLLYSCQAQNSENNTYLLGFLYANNLMKKTAIAEVYMPNQKGITDVHGNAFKPERGTFSINGSNQEMQKYCKYYIVSGVTSREDALDILRSRYSLPYTQ